MEKENLREIFREMIVTTKIILKDTRWKILIIAILTIITWLLHRQSFYTDFPQESVWQMIYYVVNAMTGIGEGRLVVSSIQAIIWFCIAVLAQIIAIGAISYFFVTIVLSRLGLELSTLWKRTREIHYSEMNFLIKKGSEMFVLRYLELEFEVIGDTIRQAFFYENPEDQFYKIKLQWKKGKMQFVAKKLVDEVFHIMRSVYLSETFSTIIWSYIGVNLLHVTKRRYEVSMAQGEIKFDNWIIKGENRFSSLRISKQSEKEAFSKQLRYLIEKGFIEGEINIPTKQLLSAKTYENVSKLAKKTIA